MFFSTICCGIYWLYEISSKTGIAYKLVYDDLFFLILFPLRVSALDKTVPMKFIINESHFLQLCSFVFMEFASS